MAEAGIRVKVKKLEDRPELEVVVSHAGNNSTFYVPSDAPPAELAQLVAIGMVKKASVLNLVRELHESNRKT